MSDHDTRPDSERDAPDPARRRFVALSAAAGIAVATARTAAAAGSAVIEREVQIQTAAGTCDAAFCHPSRGRHPGVLIWTDIFGLRPTFRAMGRRLAQAGYAVLVPNPFYRTAKAPVFGDIASFNFGNEADRAKFPPLVGPLNAAGAAEADSQTYIAFLDAQHQVDKTRRIGTQGYCMGGPLVMKSAAANSQRVGAVASFHGGGLVTDKPDSPHRLIPKMTARVYVAIASNDDARQPDAKDTLRSAFAAAHLTAEVEVYPGAQHGWCVPDMPAQEGKAIYEPVDAERAWSKLLALYRDALA